MSEHLSGMGTTGIDRETGLVRVQCQSGGTVFFRIRDLRAVQVATHYAKETKVPCSVYFWLADTPQFMAQLMARVHEDTLEQLINFLATGNQP